MKRPINYTCALVTKHTEFKASTTPNERKKLRERENKNVSTKNGEAKIKYHTKGEITLTPTPTTPAAAVRSSIECTHQHAHTHTIGTSFVCKWIYRVWAFCLYLTCIDQSGMWTAALWIHNGLTLSKRMKQRISDTKLEWRMFSLCGVGVLFIYHYQSSH